MKNSSSLRTDLNRDSNMELARIVAMAMILIGHFVFHGLQKGMPFPEVLPVLGGKEIILLSVWALCTPGVDLFVLISGYYGIKLNWKSLISFWLLCVFYNTINLFVNTPLSGITFIKAIDVLFISRTGNWFFKAYFWLMMTSPILNKALSEFGIKALRLLCGIGIVLLCVSSWKFANPDGNTALMLMVLYFIGGYLRKEPIIQNITEKKAFAGYLTVATLTILSGILVHDCFHKQYGILLQHNSLLVIIMAISLLLFFRTLDIRSKAINMWASTVVAALFIQDMILYVPLYDYFHTMYLQEGLSGHVCLSVIAATFLIFLAAFIIELPRKKIAGKLAGFAASKLNGLLDFEKILRKNNQ